MPINGSDLINDPWNTTFSPFTDLFGGLLDDPELGGVFYLVVLCFVTVALYVKVRDPSTVSVFMIASGVLLAGGTMFVGASVMSLVFTAFATLGLVWLLIDNLKRG